jgi:hypothetical protein
LDSVRHTENKYPAMSVVLKESDGLIIMNKSISSLIEIYPGPGVETYRSDLYTVDIHNGSAWQPAYLYKVARLATCSGWHRAKHPSVNFTTFGTNGPVRVRLAKEDGAIEKIEISPKSKAIGAELSDGSAVFTLNPLDKVWITINDDDASPVFLFADNPKPDVPEGADYFGPGVHEIGHLYAAEDDRAVYLDGGAWLKGNLDLRGKRNVCVMGPGVLSGELWSGESLEGLPREEAWSYHMIATYPHQGKCRGNRLDGITIVNAPGYHTFYGLQTFYNTKLISPWYGSTDGFYLSPTSEEPAVVDQCFAFVGDDVFFTRDNCSGNMIIKNSFVNSSNNNIFCMSYWGNPLDHDHTMVARNIDIKVTPWHAIFLCVLDGKESNQGVKNHVYEDIRIEGDLNWNSRLVWIENRPYPWPPPSNSSKGNAFNLTFRNISIEARQNLEERRSRIIGLDEENGIRDVFFENLNINGVSVTEANRKKYFEINEFARNIRFKTD